MNKFWVISILIGQVSFCFTQNLSYKGEFAPPDTPAVIEVSRAHNPISIDGALTEGEWQKAVPITDFFRQEPRQGGPIRYQTEVRFLYDVICGLQ